MNQEYYISDNVALPSEEYEESVSSVLSRLTSNAPTTTSDMTGGLKTSGSDFQDQYTTVTDYLSSTLLAPATPAISRASQMISGPDLFAAMTDDDDF